MAPNDDTNSIREPLLLPALIAAHRGNTAGDGTITAIIRGLMGSPMTDAERAGERLCVFGWQLPDSDRSRMRWCYRVIGEETGRELVEFTLTVPGGVSDLPCRVLGLQLQITLNGVEHTDAEELDAYMELAEAARNAA